MPNTFLTPQVIAREALLRLHSTFVGANLVYRDYSPEFAMVGDTVTIRKPAVFVAQEFNGSIVTQNIGEGKVPIKMDTLLDVSVNVTSQQMTLDIKDFGTQVIDGAMLAIAEGVNSKVLRVAAQRIPFYTGTAGTTPASIAAGFTDPMEMLDENKVPMDMRVALFNPAAKAKLIALDAILNADKSGSTDALRRASLGNIMNMETFMDQSVYKHTAGAYTSLTDVTVTGTITHDTENANKSTIQLTSAGGAATTALAAGDLFEVDDRQYVVISATANAVAGVISSVQVYPKFHVDAVGDLTAADVEFADQSSKAHVSNLAFHKKAIALVTRPLEMPMGKGTEQAYVAQDPMTGLAVRVVMDYDKDTKQSTISFDALFGVDVIFPQLATQILG